MAKLFMQENKNQNFLHGDMNNPDELLNQRCLYYINYREIAKLSLNFNEAFLTQSNKFSTFYSWNSVNLE